MFRRHRKREPHVFDCQKNFWGHAVHLDNNKREVRRDKPFWPCRGHLSPLPQVSDRVIVQFGKGPVICTFIEVDPCGDPADMFFGKVRGDGYWDGEPEASKAFTALLV